MPKKTTKENHDHSHENKHEELQEKYMEYQMLKQQIGQFVEQKQQIDEHQNELRSTIESLNKLSTVKKDEEIWSPFGNGTFVRSGIKDTEKVMVSIGAGIVIKETIPQAIKIIESRLDEMDLIGLEIMKQANSLMERLNKLEPELEKLAKAAQ